MAQVNPFPSGCNARDRLEKALREESQRIQQACLQLADVNTETEPNRFEALVRAMLDALDRQVDPDSAAAGLFTAQPPAGVFGSSGVQPSAGSAAAGWGSAAPRVEGH